MTTVPAPIFIEAPPEAAIGVYCRGCKMPFALWDTLHPLFRSWSGKCPDCHMRDIRLDFAHQNQES